MEENSEKQIYVGDFDGNKEDEKTILEKKVLSCENLSTEDKLQIIRAIEHSQNLLFEKENSTPYITYKPYESLWFTNHNSDLAAPVICKTTAVDSTKLDTSDSELEKLVNAI